MPNLFISHSSHDKPFVKRLAVDLINHGFPVWFDAWQIELGDSLLKKIHQGLDDASYLLMVLSRSSLASHWVNHEIEAALAQEARRKSTVLIPILLDDADVPDPIRARLCADFRESYALALDRLCQFMRRKGIDKVESSAESALVPLVLLKNVHLDSTVLVRRMEHLRRRHPDLRLDPRQLVLVGDDIYQRLRNRMIERMTNIESDPYFSPEFLQRFSSDYHSILDTEKQFMANLAVLIGELSERQGSWLADASYWYMRERLSHLLYFFWAVQNPNLPDPLPRDPQWEDWRDLAKLHKLPNLDRLVVMVKRNSRIISSNGTDVPADSQIMRFLRSLLPDVVHEPLASYGNSDGLFSKYIVPQAFRVLAATEATLFLNPDACHGGLP
jgi:hypothetical protein